MENFFYKLKDFFEKIDGYRDKLLFLFIKPYWPRKIIPNYITYIRVVVGIVIFALLFFFNKDDKLLIITLFIIGAITDFIDGPIARGTNQVTEFGATLDATADRILIIPIAFYSLLKFQKQLLFILVLVETLNAIASIYYKSKEIYLESNIFGKAKMTLLSVIFIVILIIWPSHPTPVLVYGLWLSIPLSLMSILLRITELKYEAQDKNL